MTGHVAKTSPFLKISGEKCACTKSCGSADGCFPEESPFHVYNGWVSFTYHSQETDAEFHILKVVSRTFVLSVIVMNNTGYHWLCWRAFKDKLRFSPSHCDETRVRRREIVRWKL